MPEGDILRRTASTLDRALSGHQLVAAELRWPSAAGIDLVGRTVVGTHAYGKHLFTRFDDGRTLHTHLRMEGSWSLEPTREPAPGVRAGPRGRARGAFVRAVLTTADWTAVGHRVGMLDVVPTRDDQSLIAHLGPDVLADDFEIAGLPEALERYRRVAERGVAVGEVLLDQTVLAGIGTIYMAESLYARRIWPWTPGADVADPASLMMTARVLMQRSVQAQEGGGPSPWTDRQAHGRSGEPCRRCATPIAVGDIGQPPRQRPAFYCPTCQAAPTRSDRGVRGKT
jgi:endonuclease-8